MPVFYKSNLNALEASLVGVMNTGSKATAEDIGDLAQQLAPEDTGELKASKKVEQRGRLWVVSFGDGLQDARAVWQEMGTATMPAQPYFTPAVRQIDLTFRYKEAMAAAIAKVKV